MSINVTVSGNPVSIKRGKMVTTDLNHVDKEFQKRRRMRLEQVRQQSKDIAESVRNKVRKEKSKQLSKFDKENASKLEEIKNRKLVELQNQYQDCLKDIGLAHTQARITEAEEMEEMIEMEEIMNKKAKERGDMAMEKEQIIANEKNLKKAIPMQNKRIARDVENARASMITQMKRKKVKKPAPARREMFQSDSDFSDIVNITDPDEITVPPNSKSKSNSSKNNKEQGHNERAKVIQVPTDTTHTTLISSNSVDEACKKQSEKIPELQTRIPSPKGGSSFSKIATENSTISYQNSMELPIDTRISQRINNRKIPRLVPQQTIAEAENFEEESKQPSENQEASQSTIKSLRTNLNADHICQPINRYCNCTRNRPRTNVNANYYETFSQQCEIPSVKKCDVSVQKTSDLPTKPTISIRSSVCPTVSKSEYNRVQYYDHNNRFSSNYIADNSNVEKISADRLEVCTNTESDKAVQELVFQREKDADIRGKVALEKAKIQKEYEELIKRLPILQKQERIAALDPKKDKLHMSDQRLGEYEKSRQHKLESAFEKLVPNTITIQPKTDVKEKEVQEPFQIIDINNANTLTVAKWEEDDKGSQDENLRCLLERLKMQKDMLMKENDMPNNLQKIINDIEESEKFRKSPVNEKQKKRKHVQRSSSSVASSSSPIMKHKRRSRRDILVLQNISTQTSPKILKSTESNTTSSLQKTSEKMVVGKCECKSEELCQILIKIQENDKPEILITSPQKRKDFIVNTENKPLQTSSKSLQTSPRKSEPDTKTEEVKGKIQPTNAFKKKEVKIKVNNISKKSSSSFWMDQLSKNETIQSTSSTSYYSPPDYSKTTENTTNNSNLNFLQKPPQQSNIGRTSKRKKDIDPRLITYIKKLLTMSKSSLEDLAVSSDSNVSTPSSSIINMDSNHPRAKLMNVLKFFNLNLDDISENLNNTESTVSSKNRNRTCGSSCYNASQSQSVHTNNESNKNQSQDPRELTIEEYTEMNYPDIIANKYSELANVCQQRIDNLAAMIEKVRTEKQQILSPTNSTNDKEKTSYLTLPSHLEESSDKSNSPEQKELTNQLLKVNKNEVPTDADNIIKNLIQTIKDNTSTKAELDPEIVERYLKLLTSESNFDNDAQNSVQKEQSPFVPVLLDIPKLPKFTSENGAQVLHDKRPPPSKGLNNARKFNGEINIIPHELSTIPEADSMRRSKSPEVSQNNEKQTSTADPSHLIKIIDNIRIKSPNTDRSKTITPSSSNQSPQTYNVKSGNVTPQDRVQSPRTYSLSPRDTSNNSGKICCGTQVKQQSNIQTSTPRQISPRPEASCSAKACRGTQVKQQTNIQYSTPRQVSPQSETLSQPQPGTSKGTTKSKQLNTMHIEQILKKLQEVSTDSSTDKSELDVEAMLKNMGMEWAVATLRKTQEALARQSSSTSSLNSTNKQSESGSDVSLKGYMPQEIFKSSSTAKSDTSISPFLKEFHDISAIHGLNNDSVEKHQRTSTPVQSLPASSGSKSVSNKDKASGESNVTDGNFISLPEHSGNSNLD